MNKAALVTGASKRIGRQIALTLAADGWDIAVHYRGSQKEAMATAQEIRALGRRCELFEADLGDMRQVERLVPAVADAMPGLELLVNNASIFEPASFLETQEAFFDRIFTINFKSCFFLARDFARICRKGQIVNMLDTKIARSASPSYFAYTLGKKALAAFTEMAAKELAPDIRVNGICPGPILPPPGKDSDYLEKFAGRVPLKRIGSPELIVDAILFLVRNSYVTGQWLFVDGGEHLG